MPGVFPTSYAYIPPPNPNLHTLDSSTCGIDIPEWDLTVPAGLDFSTFPPTVIYKTITIFSGKSYLIDGIWAFNTCTMAIDNTLNSAESLTIPLGTTLKLNGHSLTNYGGTITNQGKIRCKPIFDQTCGITNYGTIINEGSLDFGYGIASTVVIDFLTGGLSAVAAGILSPTSPPFSYSASQLTNYGTVENTGTSAAISFTIGEIFNHGVIKNDQDGLGGTITLLGTPFNQSAGASIINFKGGTITAVLTTIQNNGGTINNAGSITLGSSQAVTVPETKGQAKVNLPEPAIIDNFNNGIVVNNDTGFLSAEYSSALNNGLAENVTVLLGLCLSCSPAFNVDAGTFDNNGTMNFVSSTFDNANGTFTNFGPGVMYFQPWNRLGFLLSTVKLLYTGSALYNGLNSTKGAPGTTGVTCGSTSGSCYLSSNGGPGNYVCLTNSVTYLPIGCALTPYGAASGGFSPQALPGIPNFSYDEAHSEFINNGSIGLGDATVFGSSGNFTNNGEIQFGADGKVPGQQNIHDSFGVFNDYGVVNNSVEFSNYGNFTQECGAYPIYNYVGSSFVQTGGYVNATNSADTGPAVLEPLTNFYNLTSPSCSLSDTAIHSTSFSFPVITPISFLNSTSTSTTTTTTTTSASPVCDTSTASSCTTAATVENGSALVDQTSNTGVYVQISAPSAPNGTSVTVTSSDLGGKPSGTANIQLSGESFYDVNVSQSASLGSDAVATVCINVTSQSTTMEYWNGTVWVDAFDVTVSGNTVCGTIQVSSLTGTSIVIGSPVGIQPPPMVDANVTIYSSTDGAGEILFTANATIYNMHSYPFTESAVPQYGTIPNVTNYGYLGYYQGTFAAVSGGQKGANVSITVAYDGVSETGYALDPGTAGNITTINFVFNSTTGTSNSSAASQSPESVGISALLLSALTMLIVTGNFIGSVSKFKVWPNRKELWRL